VTFAAAAGSWERSPELRQRLLAAVGSSTVPILLIQAANDFSTAPSQALGDELERLKKPHLVKIYPPVGNTPEDGHNLLYEAMPEWENDVFTFLDKYVKP
jgi:pimeloyl-ACP methyl ester carboxylesterase